ncbi:GNAT family N-acetyltransferase [Sphaerochaeta sp. PS]|uniref:GNAT family N-acetyltransferase n=1 Tax=Sphaerochaeta sp. PS TaxID=3076336 RepID=UPI0028A5018E|nr:GNAT family N-acetyltransferase [Sphaerochaeta sp. PS]MDT4762139.1 GNAT family N-acetyltransferase [Sphaerochaeta sp. PS]
MPDMLVKLYALPELETILQQMDGLGLQIRRAMAPDKVRILAWIGEHSTQGAVGEADVCFSHTPISLFLATRGSEILGFACYNATAPNFFGPTRVLEAEQGKGIGKALLLKSLYALKDQGYGYAIIGGVGPVQFYEKCVGATLIEGSKPGIYKDYLGVKP